MLIGHVRMRMRHVRVAMPMGYAVQPTSDRARACACGVRGRQSEAADTESKRISKLECGLCEGIR